MTGLHELSFNGYRLDTRNGRKFDATLVHDRQAVPAGLYEMGNGTKSASFPRQQSSVVREYGLRPATQKNVTPRFYLSLSAAVNKPGIRADALLGSLPLDGQMLLVRYSAPWMLTARAELGEREVDGANAANPRILEYFKASSFGSTDDSTGANAWCASFVSWVMKQHGYDPPAAAFRALAWTSFGQAIPEPVYGAIGVKSRKGGGGHVSFVVGKSADGKQLYMLGGNQDDSVNVARYERSDWHTFVFPPGCSAAGETLPVYKGGAAAAGNEA